MREPIPWPLRKEVALRAEKRCEYCGISEDHTFALHHVDHIIALKHGGTNALDNLALCCVLCNRRKSADLSSVDPESGTVVVLFHPRRDNWGEHFALSAGELVGLTPSGRATIKLLRMNTPDRLKERKVRLGLIWTREG